MTAPIADDVDYLADSMFDYPGGLGGWAYLTLDAENRVGYFIERDASRGTATPRAYMVSEDPDCFVGRDFLHAGYTLRPSLLWHAVDDGLYRLSGEFALADSQAVGGVWVTVDVDDVRLVSMTLNYPEQLRFDFPARVSAGGTVRLVVCCHAHIDHNLVMFSMRICRAPGGQVPMSRVNLPEHVLLEKSASLAVLEAALRDVLPAGTGEATLSALAHNPFCEPTRIDAACFREIVTMHERLYPHLYERFRQPGLFSVANRTDGK